MDKTIVDLVKELQQIRIDIQNGQRKLEDAVSESLEKVDALKDLLDSEFDLTTAIALCKAGYFVQNDDFRSKESMHYYDANLYYEDGTVVNIHFLKDSDLENNWRVKKNPLEVDLLMLRDLHREAKGKILFNGSYEDCFK